MIEVLLGLFYKSSLLTVETETSRVFADEINLKVLQLRADATKKYILEQDIQSMKKSHAAGVPVDQESLSALVERVRTLSDNMMDLTFQISKLKEGQELARTVLKKGEG